MAKNKYLSAQHLCNSLKLGKVKRKSVQTLKSKWVGKDEAYVEMLSYGIDLYDIWLIEQEVERL